ncbi:hypothetical protein VPNG_07312 [Cytospora leucostoma]|uniref:Uncharacterized protein n=1 Tax=Cytospora leucostoma TaxID=1230097 RepID=A0A423WV00_9PEZI|nr:hypothetical protein VPNG_07312 [Cytospora leucostoma]
MPGVGESAAGEWRHAAFLEQVTDEEWQAELQRMEEETDEGRPKNPRWILIAVKPREGGTSAKIETLVWGQDRIGGMTEEQAKIDVVVLCRSIAECDLDAAPDYHPFLYSGIPASMRTPEMLATAVPLTDVQSGTN